MPDNRPEKSKRTRKRPTDEPGLDTTTHAKELAAQGLVFPPADTLNDEELSAKLGDLVRGLARIRVFLSHTNHLSDRELYALLLEDWLQEPVLAVPRDAFTAWELDLLSRGREEDLQVGLKYYDDDEQRKWWAKIYGKQNLPKRETLPYDRDRHLPKLTYEVAPEVDEDE